MRGKAPRKLMAFPCTKPRVMFAPATGKGRWSCTQVGAAATSQAIDVDCGQCINCRLNKQAELALRMELESRMHAFSAFATLTYADEHLPTGGTLDPRHLQLFLKRFRRQVERASLGARVRFVACGEYGSKGKRPHYHAILYMGDFEMPESYHWRTTPRGDRVYRSEFLEKAWPFGMCEFGAVTTESCRYVARYQVKRLTGDKASDYLWRHDNDSGKEWYVAPEFTRMSTVPGIGAPFLAAYPRDVIGSDGKTGVVLYGRHQAMPRYFFRLLKRNSALFVEREQLLARWSALRASGDLAGELKVELGKSASRIRKALRRLSAFAAYRGMDDVVKEWKASRALEAREADVRKHGGSYAALDEASEIEAERIGEYREYVSKQWKESL